MADGNSGQVRCQDGGRRPCKIGTVPQMVWVHGRDTVEAGKPIRIRYEPRQQWQTVIVDSVLPDGYFFANLM